MASDPSSLISTREERPLQECLQVILDHSFDADSKICLITMMKLLDNILQQPDNEKVRKIRLGNATFDTKVGQRKGGIDFLKACGFEHFSQPPPLMSNQQVDTSNDFLILTAQREKTQHLIAARRLLTTTAIQALHCRAEELPKYKPPPPVVSSSNNNRAAAAGSGLFDPYRPQRYDGLSAAAGTSLGPSGGGSSKTQAELQRLQKEREQLQRQLQKPIADRALSAWRPGSNVAATAPPLSEAAAASSRTDASLLAGYMKSQQEARVQREQLTTKAMRDLKTLQKQKVYSHVQLRIQFPDGIVVSMRALPQETIETIVIVLQQECLIVTMPMELYITPPRRKLNWKQTLQQEGLVPAAKVFVSWTTTSIPQKEYLQPHLFATAAPPSDVVVPQGKAIIAEKSNAKNKEDTSSSSKKKSAKKSEDREEAMLRRMLGGGGKPLGGGGASAKKKDGGGGAPKWFKK